MADTSLGLVNTAAGRMPLVDHLRELRNRLGWSLLAITICVIGAGVFFWEPLFEFIRAPYEDAKNSETAGLYSFTPLAQFSVRIRVSVITGVIVASPVWLYHLGRFITPGLHKKEKRYAGGFLGTSLLLFLGGAALAYLTVAQGLAFLLNVGGEEITDNLSIDSYLSFFTLTLLAFGVAFEFPVVVTFLNFVGVFPSQKMRAWRRGMVVGLFAFSAVITPSQDPIGMAVLAVALYLLYEVCIVIARLRERAARKRRAKDPDAALSDDEASYVDPRPSAVQD